LAGSVAAIRDPIIDSIDRFDAENALDRLNAKAEKGRTSEGERP
jgi:hypothetical protein